MSKRGVTIFLTVLLAICLIGMEQIKSGREKESLMAEAKQRSETDQAKEEGADGEKLVALTFDDGPHGDSTKRLLEGLKERDVKATFFLIGVSIEGNEELVNQMAQDGHLVGSHTFHHVQLTKLSLKEACEEITMTNEAIKDVTGQTVEYIRPPYGSWNSKLECAVNMHEVGWTVDPRDWDVKNTETIVKRVLADVKDGSIILLHDVYDTSVEAAFQIVDELKAEGYTFVTVDRLLID